MLFLFVFLLLMAGVALLFTGSFTWRGQTVSARTARQVGGVFVSLLPAAIVATVLLNALDPDHQVSVALVHWPMAALWLGVGTFLLGRELRGQGKRRPRVVNTTTFNPYTTEPEAAAGPLSPFELAHGELPPPPTNPGGPPDTRPASPRPKNPFDFS